MHFDPSQRRLNIRVDFEVGSRFAVPGQIGEHPVHDTVTKTCRHLNFFPHECELEVRIPRVKLPDGKVMQITPPWSGKLCGFTLLFEAFVLLLAGETSFSGAARISGLSVHWAMALCERSVNEAVGIDLSPAFIRGVSEHLPDAQITVDKFHLISHASQAIATMRRIEQKLDPSLKGERWVLLMHRAALTVAQRSELERLLAKMTTTRTARAWQCREEPREILTRKQPNVARLLLNRWCSNVLRSKVEPMKDVAEMVRAHLEGILARSLRARPTGSWKLSMGSSRLPSARPAGTAGSVPSAWSSS